MRRSRSRTTTTTTSSSSFPRKKAGPCCCGSSTDGARTPARQPQHRRILHVRLRHDDRRRLARPDGRLADARRPGRRHPGLPVRRAAALSDRTHLRPPGAADPGRGRGDRVHGRRHAAGGQLRRRLDDGAVVRDCVSVGGGRDRQPAGARLPGAQQLSALRHRRQPDLRAAARGRPRADGAGRRGELSRDQAERHLPGRDDVRPARDVRRLHGARLRQRVGVEHAAAVRARAGVLAVDLSRPADRAVLHDRLRVGGEGIGGSEGRLRSAQLHARDLRGADRRAFSSTC